MNNVIEDKGGNVIYFKYILKYLYPNQHVETILETYSAEAFNQYVATNRIAYVDANGCDYSHFEPHRFYFTKQTVSIKAKWDTKQLLKAQLDQTAARKQNVAISTTAAQQRLTNTIKAVKVQKATEAKEHKKQKYGFRKHKKSNKNKNVK